MKLPLVKAYDFLPSKHTVHHSNTLLSFAESIRENPSSRWPDNATYARAEQQQALSSSLDDISNNRRLCYPTDVTVTPYRAQEIELGKTSTPKSENCEKILIEGSVTNFLNGNRMRP